MKKLFFLLVILSFSKNLLAKTDKNQSYERYWVQYSDNNSLFFRFISDNVKKACPIIKIDNKNIKTQERIHDYKEEFPIKVCQVEFNNNNHIVDYKNLHVKTKIENIDKISIIGDTGCITGGKKLEQNCRKLEEYPFSEIAQKIEESKSDLIIHVGDYFYSKHKCINDENCKNRPYGDKFDTWKVDFLDNANKFFHSAPIIFTRGNHESCERGGKGWSVIFDPTTTFKKCSKFNQPYSIELNNTRFLMLDSGYAPDSKKKFQEFKSKGTKLEKIELIQNYQSQIDNLLSKATTDKQNIIISHKPIWSREYRPWQDGEVFECNYLLNNAINKSKYRDNISNINMILSGHTHTNMLIEFTSKNYHFYQIVAGNSGAFLNKAQMINKNTKKIFDKKIKNTFEYKDFGYSELYLKNNKVNSVKFFKYNGKPIKALIID